MKRYLRTLTTFMLFVATVVGMNAQTASFSTSTTNFDPEGGTATFDVSFTYTGLTLAALGFEIDLPDGWSYGTLTAASPQFTPPTAPAQGTTGKAEFFYNTAPADMVSFSYTMNYPSGLTGDQQFDGMVLYTVEGQSAATAPISATISAPLAAPSFTLHPESQEVNEGGFVNFYASADGNPTPTLQWNKDGSPISGATDISFEISVVSISDAGVYSVTATNSEGSVTSNDATITVNTGPVITDDPDSDTVNQGSDISLSVTASGSMPLSYQWRKNGSPISGATDVTLQLNDVQPEDAASYDVVVTNNVSSATSAAAVITVIEAPQVNIHPTPVTVEEGESASFSVSYTGSDPVSFQWMKDGADIGSAAATDSTYTIDSTMRGDSGQYSVRLTNAAGSVTSNNAELVVQHAPVIDEDPENLTSGVGGSVTFEVSAFGNPEITTYQWFSTPSEGGTPTMVGTNSAGLELTGLQLSDNGSTYYVDVTNSIGTTTSATATLTVNQGPAFTLHPVDVTVTEGGDTVLYVSVTGNPEPTLQWQYSPDEEMPMSDLPGETDSVLNLTAINRSQAGYYQVVASSSIDTIESDEAFVDVQYAPEITEDVQDQAGGVGGSVTFNVEGVANPSPTFQWFRNGDPISGATEGEYTAMNLTLEQSGDTFYLVADNGIGDPVQSRTATLTVNESPVITLQPSPVTVLEGEPASFTVEFRGNPTPTLQWMLNGQPISGETSATLNISATSRANSGEYTLVATNEFGSDTSTAAVLDVQFAPEITRDLSDITANVGSTVTLSLDGAANPEPMFQWYRDDSPISGATDGELVLEDVQLEDSGATFFLEVNNGIGETVRSSVATLTVVSPASITQQPTGATLDAGQSHTMSIAVEGDPTPTIQWFFNGEAISGATSLSYTVSNAASANGGSYHAVATNSGGSETSNSVSVVVNTPPSVNTQPAGATVIVGESFSTSVMANGLAPLSYQWRKDGVDIAGATSATFSINPVAVTDAGAYSVVVTNRLGSATSADAVLTVNLKLRAPSITQQPGDVRLKQGETATLSVVASGNPVPTYQWSKNGAAIAGATGASLTLDSAAGAIAGTYVVTITNSQGSVTSNLVRVSLTEADEAPVITSQPRNRTAALTESTTFSVAATGVPAPTFQWKFNGTDIAGATGATHTVADITTSSAGNYSVEVTNSAGSVTSRNALLAVITVSYQGTYFGSFGPDRGSFAITIDADNTGTFLGFDEVAELYVAGDVKVNDDGSFSFTITSQTPVAPASDGPVVSRAQGVDTSGVPTIARAEVTISGTIGEDGTVGGTVEGVAGLSMTGTKEEGTDTEDVAGFYQSSASGSDAVSYTIIAPNGKVLVFTETPEGADAGVGTVDSSGQVSVTTVSRNTVTATVASNTSTIQTEVTDSTGNKTTFSGGNSEVIATQRLVNISSRAAAGSGEAQTIAGLVITGEDSKPVLIRAVGPGLTEFGVNGVLTAPKLDLYSGQTVIATNTGWATSGQTTEIEAAASLAGAFPLDAASADSVLLETLAPGSYTAQVSGNDGGSGVVLVEVYDLSSPTLGQKLFNISTRASAGAGNETVVAGFVVSGSVPKRVLLRGVGPTLAGFGVNNALVDPQIRLFRDTTLVATNDDWGTNATAVSTASNTTGAFQLADGSKDAAMVISLEPGAYTLHMSGAGGASGIGLIEVYEIP